MPRFFCVYMSLKIQVSAAHGRVARSKKTRHSRKDLYKYIFNSDSKWQVFKDLPQNHVGSKDYNLIIVFIERQV